MTFVNTLMSFLSDGLSFLGDAFYKLFSFLATPLGWLISFFEGIFYFLAQLFMVVVAIIKIFVALFQFLFAIIAGFLRTIQSFLVIDVSKTPLHYPSETQTGMSVVMELLSPVGFLTVVPMVLLAIVWLFFVLRIFALIGGETTTDA